MYQENVQDFLMSLERFTMVEDRRWEERMDREKFACDADCFYLENTTFIIPGKHFMHLLGVLNPKVAKWKFGKNSNSSGLGGNRRLKYKIEQLPVSVPTPAKEAEIEGLVGQVLAGKKAGEDTGGLKAEIDRLVWRSYGVGEAL